MTYLVRPLRNLGMISTNTPRSFITQAMESSMRHCINFSARLHLLAIIFASSLPASTNVSERQPNVIIVITDDQGYGDMACHGHPFANTPNIDRLYSQSVRLTDFHVMPLCAPTRAMLMTGRNPLRDGVWATVLGRSILPAGTPTIANYFSANGYATGMFGKWHLGDNAPARPQDKGFQTAFYHGGGGVGQTPDFWANDYRDDTYFLNGKPVKTNGYCTDVWFGAALDFMRANREKPFLAYIATNAPHAPYIAPLDLKRKYEDIPGMDASTAAFYAMIENIDTNLGRLMQFMIEESLEENTILIFMTDNGTAHGTAAKNEKLRFNAGMRGAKGTLYDGGHRVPCFIRWPKGGLPGENGLGRDYQGLACAADLLPTVASLCGIDLKPNSRPLDGIDLAPFLKSQTESIPPDRTLFMQFAQADTPPKRGQGVVLTNQWRLINQRELYEIKADPSQRTNQMNLRNDVARKLNEEYNRWFDDVERIFKEQNPIWIGSELENPVRLNCMDWHTGGTPANLPWDQTMIRKGLRSNGYWAIDVRQPGAYEIKLARWPEESMLALSAVPENAGRWPVAHARLMVGKVDAGVSVDPKDCAAVFHVNLQLGQQQLKTEFKTAQGDVLGGAYYVTIRRK